MKHDNVEKASLSSFYDVGTVMWLAKNRSVRPRRIRLCFEMLYTNVYSKTSYVIRNENWPIK